MDTSQSVPVINVLDNLNVVLKSIKGSMTFYFKNEIHKGVQLLFFISIV